LPPRRLAMSSRSSLAALPAMLRESRDRLVSRPSRRASRSRSPYRCCE
jgi:hypothetical protein